ncbi:MAG TPA: metallophosphoesterase [Methylovirgula sp.]
MTFLLAHLSDAHIGPLPQPRRRELIGKRLTGYLNWTGARAQSHDMDLLAALVADMKAQKPDHIAMTGDILNIGLKAEYPLARRWLETLGDPHDVSFVPGNHDAYVRGTMGDLATTFAPWTKSDAGDSGYPYLRLRGNVALIGLSSGVPTAPFIASGQLGRAQCEAAAKLLAETGRAGHVRVALIHHPPQKDGASFGRALRDADAFESVIRRIGAELILHGHNHRLMADHMEGPNRPVPVVGVGSASAARGTPGHRAAYHLFEIDGNSKAPKIRARVRGIAPGREGKIVDLGAIAL